MDQNMGLVGKFLVYMEYFWLLMLKFSLAPFSGAFPIFTDLVHVVSRKRLIVERTAQNLDLRVTI